MSITSMTKKGQVTIPVEVRRALQIKEKDRVEITVEGDKAVVRKVARASELRGSVSVGKAQKGVSWKKIERKIATVRGGQGT